MEFFRSLLECCLRNSQYKFVIPAGAKRRGEPALEWSRRGPAFSMTFISAASSGIFRVFPGHDARVVAEIPSGGHGVTRACTSFIFVIPSGLQPRGICSPDFLGKFFSRAANSLQFCHSEPLGAALARRDLS
jgi:hypothetical protein